MYFSSIVNVSNPKKLVATAPAGGLGDWIMNATFNAPLVKIPDIIEAKPLRSTRTKTTLFGLIAALQDVADPDGDAAVIATMAELSRSGRFRLCTGFGNNF